ncbi:hypothetical protein Tco_0247368 [Tanacetum coccineum]
MMDAQLSSRLEDSIKKSFRSYTSEFEKKAKDERKRYIDLVEKSVKEIINDEVKNQLPEILPKEVSDYATPFELKKILLDKIQKSKSYRGAQEHKDHYDTLVKSYKLDKDLFESYGKVYSLKRGQEDKDKDEDPPAGLDQGLKKQKTSKDVEPSRGSKTNVFETADTKQDEATEYKETIWGTCKSRVELEYHFEECYKVVTDKLDWMNPEGHEYPFDLMHRNMVFPFAMDSSEDALSFLSGWKTFNWESKATRRSLISLGLRLLGPTSQKLPDTLHTTIHKESSIKTSSKEIVAGAVNDSIPLERRDLNEESKKFVCGKEYRNTSGCL